MILSFFKVFNTALSVVPSDSTLSEDAGIEPRTVATLALTARRVNHSARSHLIFKNFCPQLKIAVLLTAEQQLVSQANLPIPSFSEAKAKGQVGPFIYYIFLSLA